jgi:hypothetical protein
MGKRRYIFQQYPEAREILVEFLEGYKPSTFVNVNKIVNQIWNILQDSSFAIFRRK